MPYKTKPGRWTPLIVRFIRTGYRDTGTDSAVLRPTKQETVALQQLAGLEVDSRKQVHSTPNWATPK